MVKFVVEELSRLFSLAQKVDEFEFVNVLIGFNGMGDQRALTHLFESRQYIGDMGNRFLAEENLHSKARIGLHIYCHVFEMDELYNIIGNMLRIASNQQLRYLPNLYSSSSTILTPSEKLFRLRQLAEQCRFETFVDALQNLYSKDLRNAFLHSAYSLIDNDFCIVRGKGITFNNHEHQSVDITEYLLPLFKGAIDLVTAFFGLIDGYKMSYRTPKVVNARLPDLQPVIILGDAENGLLGFQTFTGSWVKISSAYGSPQYAEAMNLSFGGGIPNNELVNKLAPYTDNLVPHGKEFEELMQQAIETGDPNLLRTLSIAYYNWANNTIQKVSGESDQKRDAMIRNAIQRYDKAIEIDPSFDRPYLNKGTALLRQAHDKNVLTTDKRRDIQKLFEKAISLNETSYESWSNSARLLLEIGNELPDEGQRISYFENSLKQYKRALDLYPHDVNIYRNLAWLHRHLADYSADKNFQFEQSIKHYEKAKSLNAGIEVNLSLASVIGEYGERLGEKGGDFIRRAIDILKEAEVSFGTSSDLSFRLGNKYLALAKIERDTLNYKTAATFLQKAVDLDSSNVRAMNNLAHCELTIAVNEEDPEITYSLLVKAKARLEKVLEIEPGHDAAWSNLGYVDMELAKKSTAENRKMLLVSSIKNLQKANEFAPNSVTFDLARAYALLGDKKRSIQFLQEWISKGNNLLSVSFTEDFEGLKDSLEYKTLMEQQS